MKSKLRIISFILIAALSFGFLLQKPASAINCKEQAGDDNLRQQCEKICTEDTPLSVRISAKCDGAELDEETSLENRAIGITNAIIAILGILATIIIIYGGFQYMTSAGDSSKTKKAKDTILYAAIGLIICALAAAIVNFVIRTATESPNVRRARNECINDLGGIWEESTHSCNINGFHY